MHEIVRNLDRINSVLEAGTAEDVLRWASELFGSKVALVTSFQITGIVTLHALKRLDIEVPVLTLDTGLLFPETNRLIAEVEAFFGIQVQRIRPRQSVAEQAAAYGPALWERQPNRCCHYRKVLPLRAALAPYDAWITGLRRDQSPLRARTPLVGWDEGQQKIKLAPFARWPESFVWEYIHAYHLPYNALHARGYPSIGCFPCTRPVRPDQADRRAGRWTGTAKTECGLHAAQPA